MIFVSVLVLSHQVLIPLKCKEIYDMYRIIDTIRNAEIDI